LKRSTFARERELAVTRCSSETPTGDRKTHISGQRKATLTDPDDDPAGAILGLIMGGLLLDEIITAAREGDEKAWAALRRMLPQDAPPGEAITWRNDEIRALANWLIETLAAPPSDHLLATLISTAGRQLAARRDLPSRRPFDRLTSDELAEFGRRVRHILERCPRWPGLRRTLEILSS
jgi:hypothetical protein